MKFHLSTLLLAMVIVALGLGWYLDHNDPRRTEIVGTWHFPYDSLPHLQLGYSTALEIREDGTFQKFERSRIGSVTFAGTYRVEKEGMVTFHVTSQTTKVDIRDALNQMRKKSNRPELPEEPPVTLDVTYTIRCAVDKSGFLILDCQDQNPFPFEEKLECKLKWDSSYERSK